MEHVGLAFGQPQSYFSPAPPFESGPDLSYGLTVFDTPLLLLRLCIEGPR